MRCPSGVWLSGCQIRRNGHAQKACDERPHLDLLRAFPFTFRHLLTVALDLGEEFVA
jgi:hypothetical protein